MDIAVIGLGSMGRRRCRLLKQLNEVANIYGVDAKKERQEQCTKELEIQCFDSLYKLLQVKSIKCVVISTPPLTHFKIIKECLNLKLHVFTEINLVSTGYEELVQKAKEINKTLFLSSTFLYRNEIKKIKEIVGDHHVNYIYHVGQYLPDWHPWESFHNFFVGDKRTNGCREIFAIDLPWILDTFGDVETFCCEKRKTSNLKIDYCDTYVVILKHKNGTLGSLIVDVVTREAKRKLEIFGEEIHVQWDGTPESLYKLNLKTSTKENITSYDNYMQDSKYASNIIEDAYKDELINYIKCINGMDTPKYSFEKDKKVIEIIDQIEK